jgi:hypothetical protein
LETEIGENMDINKIIAKKELEVIGGKPQVYRFWDEQNIKNVDILSCVERPYSGVVSYATIGLSDYDIGMLIDNKNLRVELLGAIDEKEESFINILASNVVLPVSGFIILIDIFLLSSGFICTCPVIVAFLINAAILGLSKFNSSLSCVL